MESRRNGPQLSSHHDDDDSKDAVSVMSYKKRYPIKGNSINNN